MKKSIILRKIFLVLCLFLLTLFLPGEDTLSEDNANEDMIKISEGSGYIDVDFNLMGLVTHDIAGKDGEIYQIMKMQDGGFLDETGKPKLPTCSIYLQIPDGAADVNLYEDTKEAYIKDNVSIYPAQEHPVDIEGASEPQWTKDIKFYDTYDRMWPDHKAGVSGIFKMRNTKFIMLTIYPVRYNPVRRTAEINNKMTVRIDLNIKPKKTKSKKELIIDMLRYRSENVMDKNGETPFDGLIKTFIENPKHGDIKSKEDIMRVKKEMEGKDTIGADYLIIIPDDSDFIDAIQPIVQAKEEKGLEVKVATLSEITDAGEPPTAEDITNYIRDAYFNWSPAPTYVLLVGDVELIPVHYGIIHPYSGEPTPTDLYYAEMDGDGDLFADILLGRLPVSSAGELGIAVSKILQRESLPYDHDFYTKALTAAQNARYFLITAEAIAEHLEREGYSTFRVYSGGEYTGTTDDVINSINEGVFMVVHRDHGSIAGWGSPSFKIDDIQDLDNIDMYPVMFSVNCETGHFDADDCFGEELIKVENKGVAGFFGATRVSYSGYNDELCKGFIDAVWTDFVGDYDAEYSDTTKLGAILLAGKIFMYDKYVLTNGAGYPWAPSPDTTQVEFEIFHLLGDPEANIYPKIELPYTAEIISPFGGKISEKTEIRGMVTGDSYTLEIGEGSPATDWEELVSGKDQIINGTIYILDTTQYRDGKYTLRLTAGGDEGDVIDRTIVYIDNVTINRPRERDVFDIDHVIDISATVKVDSYSYELAYASAKEPDIWRNDGLTSSNSGYEILGTLNFEGLDDIDAGLYYLKIRAEYNNGVVSEEIERFYIDDFQEGWPRQEVGGIYGPLSIFDIDLNGKEEILVGTSTGKLYAWNDDGTPVSENWPVQVSEGIWTSPAVGDIDNDGDIEIVVGDISSNISILNSDGTIQRRFRLRCFAGSSPVLADLNNDGFLEIIIGGYYYAHVGYGEIYVLDYNGNDFNSGWPVQITGTCYSAPAVADIDNDGYLDVIIASSRVDEDYQLHVLDRNGDYLEEWSGPKELPDYPGIGYSSPVIGDVDYDGRLEICVTGKSGGPIVLFKHNGILLYEDLNANYFNPILCDTNNDGQLEIVVLSRPDCVRVFNIDGFVCIYKVPGDFSRHYTKPCVADINNNGYPDVIVGSDSGGVYAFELSKEDFDNNRDPIEGWPKYTISSVSEAIAISDLDNDGDLEVVAGDISGNVYVYDLPDGYNTDWIQWPMFQHDAQNTGFYSNIPSNRPPKFMPISSQLLNEGELLEFQVNATDPENDPLTYSAENLPDGAVFNPDTRTFSWTPGQRQTGVYFNITFIVSDGSLVDIERINISVLPVYVEPTIIVEDQEVKEGELLEFTVAAEDPDGDIESYGAEDLPEGAAFDTDTHVFSWRPDYEQAGSYEVTFWVRDREGLSDSQTITINVIDVNRPPELMPIGDKSVYVFRSLKFRIYAHDPDGDALTYRVVGTLPKGARFEYNTFSWHPRLRQVGDHYVTFEVSDGELVDTETVKISVLMRFRDGAKKR